MRFAKWRTSRLSPDPSMSDAFDFDLAFDVDREGHGLSRAEKCPKKLTRLQPLRQTASGQKGMSFRTGLKAR